MYSRPDSLVHVVYCNPPHTEPQPHVANSLLVSTHPVEHHAILWLPLGLLRNKHTHTYAHTHARMTHIRTHT